MSHLATGDIRQSLIETDNAIGEAVKVAGSKPDHTCQAVASILLMLKSAINGGGGIGEWLEFSHKFGKKMLPIWERELAAIDN